MSASALRSPRVLVVCRAGRDHGFGHLTRSSAVIGELRKLGAEVEARAIFDSPGDRDAALSDCLFESLAASVPDVGALLSRVEPDAVVLDLTTLPADVFALVRERSPALISLSPVFDSMSGVDLAFGRSRALALDAAETRTGPAYAVIGDHVHPMGDAAYRSALAAAPPTVAICFGGADPTDMTQAATRALGPPALHLRVFLGGSYRGALSVGEADGMVTTRAGRALWSSMDGCCLLVAAGGQMAYEAALAGIPAVHVVRSHEQAVMLTELREAGACVVVPPSHDPWPEAARVIGALSRDPQRLGAMRAAGTALALDGGAERCAVEIVRAASGQASRDAPGS